MADQLNEEEASLINAAEQAEAASDGDKPLVVITLDQFAAVDIEEPIRGRDLGQAHALAVAYSTAHATAEAAGETDQAAVYLLLSHVCRIALQPGKKGDPWVAFASGTNWRSALPSDFKGEQTDVFETVLTTIEHPVLRARLADIVWSLDRKKGKAAHTAVAAYIEAVRGLVSGKLKSEFKGAAGYELILAGEAAHRLVQIAYMTSKRNQMPDDVRRVMSELLDQTAAQDAPVAFKRAVNVALEYGLVERAAIAPVIVAVAEKPSDLPIVLRDLWQLAADLYQVLGDEAERRQCQLRAVDQLLAMRDQVGQASAKASWTMDALQALRHVRDAEDIEEKLEIELRSFQRASRREMGVISTPMDLTDEAKAVKEAFADVTLSEGLRKIALVGRSRGVAELDKSALESITKSPLMSVFSSHLVDDEGRTSKRIDGMSLDDTPGDEQMLQAIDRLEGMRRHMIAVGAVEPARQVLQTRYSIQVEHLVGVVGPSAFVPNSQVYVMAMGFTAWLNGDVISAAHLVLPQLEPCLRQVLAINGIDTAKRRDDGTEEDLSLNSIFSRFRDDLDRILGADLSREIERLFDLRPGPALRHELAHGQLSGNACYSATVIYAVWLLYRVTVLFLLSDWERFARPAIESA